MEIVVSKDELHMQQDSILVNIEDSQRLVEFLFLKLLKLCDVHSTVFVSHMQKMLPNICPDYKNSIFVLWKFKLKIAE